MKTKDISNILHNHPYTRKHYLGTYPSDMCPKKPKPSTCFISNTDPHTEPGQHWIAIYVDYKGKVFYFDPYGIPPLSIYHQRFMNKSSDGHGTYNSAQVQNFYAKTCGGHCINFLIETCRTQDPYHTIQTFALMPKNLLDRVVQPWTRN